MLIHDERAGGLGIPLAGPIDHPICIRLCKSRAPNNSDHFIDV